MSRVSSLLGKRKQEPTLSSTEYITTISTCIADCPEYCVSVLCIDGIAFVPGFSFDRGHYGCIDIRMYGAMRKDVWLVASCRNKRQEKNESDIDDINALLFHAEFLELQENNNTAKTIYDLLSGTPYVIISESSDEIASVLLSDNHTLRLVDGTIFLPSSLEIFGRLKRSGEGIMEVIDVRSMGAEVRHIVAILTDMHLTLTDPRVTALYNYLNPDKYINVKTIKDWVKTAIGQTNSSGQDKLKNFSRYISIEKGGGGYMSQNTYNVYWKLSREHLGTINESDDSDEEPIWR